MLKNCGIAKISHSVLATKGKENEQIENVCSIDSAGSEDICFFYDKKNKALAQNIKAKACVTTADLANYIPDGVIVLISENPKLSFIELVSAFYSEFKPNAK